MGGDTGRLGSLSAAAARQSSGEPAAMGGVEGRDPFLIMYLPAFTGETKGAVLTHANILFASLHDMLCHDINREFRSLVVAPMSQIGALSASVLAVVYAGGMLVIEPFYNPSRVLTVIRDARINYMFAVPVKYQMMAKAPEFEVTDFSRVKYFISGGAPMPVEVIRQYQDGASDFPRGTA